MSRSETVVAYGLTINSIRFFALFRAFPEPSLTIPRCNLCAHGYRAAVPSARTKTLASGAVIAVLAICASADTGAAATSGCSAFPSQAAAQARFTEDGGAAGHDVEGLDGDRDGIACEGSPAPFAGYATIGYNRKRGFFYGTASMPPRDSESAGFACLYGNTHFPEGPRQLKVYAVRPAGDVAISRVLGAEAKPGSGRLVWKADKRAVRGGRYYVAFEERLRESPYGANECPGFRSREVALP